MKEKYWVPSIEKTDNVIKEISKRPEKLRLIDISKITGINKSSLFSILNTLETLGWVFKTSQDTYTLGSNLGSISAIYFKQFNIVRNFYREAPKAGNKVNEHIQLGILENQNVYYLGKLEAKSPVRLVTDPGMRFPAYASAIGAVQLLNHSKKEIENSFKNIKWEKFTPYTTANLVELISKVERGRECGYIIENQESAEGFHCVAAPVYNSDNNIIAGVSFTMPTSSWEIKFKEAKDEILELSKSLSMSAGFLDDIELRKFV